MTTTSVNIADAKEEFSELINRVSHNKERITLTRRGKDVAALVSMEDLQLLLSLQDKADLDDAMEALKETREHGTISLDSLKEQIG